MTADRPDETATDRPATSLPRVRLRDLGGEVRGDGDHVLYWMTGHRRTRFNFALQRAVEVANALGRPLLVLEALRCDYPWASTRHHRFIVEGMRDNARALEASCAGRVTFLERDRGDGAGLLEALAETACMVVTDDAPVFFLPRMVAAAAEQLDVAMEAVDSNGLLPLRAADKVFARAYDLRRYLQKHLPHHLEDLPLADPLAELETPWPEGHGALDRLRAERPWDDGLVTPGDFDDIDALLEGLPIDDSVGPGAAEGGPVAAARMLETFLEERLPRYADDRNELDHRATTELSPHLHYGHISSHEILLALAENESWTPAELSAGGRGQREGWWGLSGAAESFLDELVTWRELGYNMAWQVEDYHRYESLPDWARTTLAEHEDDERPHLYTLEELEAAETHDEIWNAAQRELVRDGRIHNYLRMLWGKKILEWSPNAQRAAEVMIELNNRYALDGRDPNSYSGIYWVLGRYDRAWGPERPIFGKIRYMSSDSTRRKMKLNGYLEDYGPDETEAARQEALFS